MAGWTYLRGAYTHFDVLAEVKNRFIGVVGLDMFLEVYCDSVKTGCWALLRATHVSLPEDLPGSDSPRRDDPSGAGLSAERCGY